MTNEDPKAEHEITTAWNFLKLEVKRVSVNHAKLRDRLIPILSQGKPHSEAEEVPGPTDPDSSPFLIGIAGVVAELRVMADAIADTEDRLQI